MSMIKGNKEKVEKQKEAETKRFSVSPLVNRKVMSKSSSAD